MAAALLARIQADLRERYAVPAPTHALLMALQTWPRAALEKRLSRYIEDAPA